MRAKWRRSCDPARSGYPRSRAAARHDANSPIYSARYLGMMEAFGGKGSYAEDSKDLPGALDKR
jgi:hypothetical protein